MAIVVSDASNSLHQLAIHFVFSCHSGIFGHCFSYLNGYYRHYGANPDKPIAWGSQQLRKNL